MLAAALHPSCSSASAGPQAAPLVGGAAPQQWPTVDRHCSGTSPRYLAPVHSMLCRATSFCNTVTRPAAASSQSE